MEQQVRAGLVGCGSVAQRGILPHLSLPDAQQQVRLVAVTDAVEERARQTAERFGVESYFTTLEAMLTGEELDLVLIATPIPNHFPSALAAIKAGKHVYIQKTMTTTLAEANELLTARDRAGVKLAAAPGFTLFPSTGQMRRLVTADVLGQVYVAYTYTMGFHHEREAIRDGSGALEAIDPGWYYRPGAGPLPDVTVYALQLITSVLGPVRRVTALSNRLTPQRTWKERVIELEIHDNTMLLMEFVTGTLGVAVGADCRSSARIPWGGLGLYGTAGTLEVTHVNHDSGYPTHFEVQGGRWADSPWPGRHTHAYVADLAAQSSLRGNHLTLEEPHTYADIMDLVAAIRTDRAPRATGEQARHVVEIIERAQVAAATGQTQELTSLFDPDQSPV